MNTSELLKKTASVLRTQEAEKQDLANKVETLEKEASINRAIVNMVKEGLLDSDEVEAKIAEFQSNPQLLEETNGFFEKSANVGELQGDSIENGTDAEKSFLQSLS